MDACGVATYNASNVTDGIWSSDHTVAQVRAVAGFPDERRTDEMVAAEELRPIERGEGGGEEDHGHREFAKHAEPRHGRPILGRGDDKMTLVEDKAVKALLRQEALCVGHEG
jgi:hypothetical protein